MGNIEIIMGAACAALVVLAAVAPEYIVALLDTFVSARHRSVAIICITGSLCAALAYSQLRSPPVSIGSISPAVVFAGLALLFAALMLRPR